VLHSQINPLKGEHARIYWYQFTDASTTIKIYNMIGDLILTVANNENFTSGQIHELPWNGRNTRGNIVGSGIYLVTIQSGDYKAWTKTAVVK
jgi:flagellar hook assembly protein FlgD